MRLYQVDAFTSEPFRGNPAGVCLVDQARDAAWMQAVAAELNLPATAFLGPGGPGSYRLRWFTTRQELELCGHATLAAAHVLWSEGAAAPDAPLRFHTAGGALAATRGQGRIWLDFPATPARPLPAGGAGELAEALGAEPRWAGRGRLDHLVELDDEAAVRRLRPDLAAVRALGSRAVIVTARADPGAPGEYDFVSRVFAPAVGIDEDQVTGSAHCSLGPYWSGLLGRERLVGYQASSRGGQVDVRVDGARVALGGQAVTVLRGRLAA
jgi:PhzF family phenazine biosynthesis protein